mmetsp:Transcript_5864/g.9779  ORF Transcript_5864/g.9779 Transcript_5864/m.9779 type:complete len:290 (+) Transcript_5864:61-930(+)
MYHVPLATPTKPKLNYSTLHAPEDKQTIQVPEDDSVPEAPDGFVFYRIQSGDTLVSLSVRFGVSQSKIQRYNNKVCFGHRLTHIVGKLLLIPTDSNANLTSELKDQLTQIYQEDETERLKHDENLDERKYAEPDENGKYQLRKALMFHATGLDDSRAAYYLGEANWNVRKALSLWKNDDKWEKQHSVMTACQLSAEEATQLLDNYHWDVSGAIRFWHNEQKKMEKITKKLEKKKGNNESTEGNTNTEMYTMQTGKDEKTQNLISETDAMEEENYNNLHQASLTSGFCCN